MSMEELSKLVKILGYTASANDNEALNACRRANELMKNLNLTWEKIIVDKTIVVNEIVNPIQQPQTSSPQKTKSSSSRDAEIVMMLQVLMSKTNQQRVTPSGKEFLRSLEDWYNRNHNLTDRQLEALRNWYNRI